MICASVVWYNLYLANQQVHLVAVHLLHVCQISTELFHLRDDSGGRGGDGWGKEGGEQWRKKGVTHARDEERRGEEKNLSNNKQRMHHSQRTGWESQLGTYE